MRTVNIHEAKTNLSRLIEQAVKCESFVIAIDAPCADRVRRLGAMAGQIQVPDDFDTLGTDAIAALFAGKP